MKLSIVPATIHDVVAMRNINESYLPENYDREMWKSIIMRFPGLSYVVKRNNQVVGYILVGLDKLEDEKREAKEPEMVGTIISIAVLNYYRNKGIGTKLLEVAHIALKESSIMKCYLHVRPSNEVAKKIYTKLGYKQVKVKENYYPERKEGNGQIESKKEDAILMMIDLR